MNFFDEVLYIDFLVSFMQNVAVALYLSAWIEIHGSRSPTALRSRRTLPECVD